MRIHVNFIPKKLASMKSIFSKSQFLYLNPTCVLVIRSNTKIMTIELSIVCNWIIIGFYGYKPCYFVCSSDQGPRFMTFYWLFFVDFILPHRASILILRITNSIDCFIVTTQRSHDDQRPNWIEILSFRVSSRYGALISYMVREKCQKCEHFFFLLMLLTHSLYVRVGALNAMMMCYLTFNVIWLYSSTLSSTSFEHSSRLQYRFQQTFLVRTISLSIYFVQVEIKESKCSRTVWKN